MNAVMKIVAGSRLASSIQECIRREMLRAHDVEGPLKQNGACARGSDCAKSWRPCAHSRRSAFIQRIKRHLEHSLRLEEPDEDRNASGSHPTLETSAYSTARAWPEIPPLRSKRSRLVRQTMKLLTVPTTQRSQRHRRRC